MSWVRGRRRWTTIPDESAARPVDLVARRFAAPERNRRWVADISYVATWSGFASAYCSISGTWIRVGGLTGRYVQTFTPVAVVTVETSSSVRIAPSSGKIRCRRRGAPARS